MPRHSAACRVGASPFTMGSVTSDGARRIEVDGEVFEVTTPPNGSSQVDLTWLSGPNPGYGFSTVRSGGVLTDEELTASIRSFLANINPDTGYLD